MVTKVMSAIVVSAVCVSSAAAVTDNQSEVYTHSVLVPVEAGSEEMQEVVTTSIEFAGESAIVRLDDLPEMVLQPAADTVSVWEGHFYNVENELMSGVTLEYAPSGEGAANIVVTVGWTDPVEITFTAQADGTLDDATKRKCVCIDRLYFCTKIKCDKKTACYGTSEGTCQWQFVKSTFVGWYALEIDVIESLSD